MTPHHETRNKNSQKHSKTASSTTRLELRIPTKHKELIEQAAKALDLTTSAFVLRTMSQVSEDILRREQVTVVPPDFYDAMIASLDSPAEPNSALADAARRSREIIRKK
jgi:uncharacterized protein (DUF1778 family)